VARLRFSFSSSRGQGIPCEKHRQIVVYFWRGRIPLRHPNVNAITMTIPSYPRLEVVLISSAEESIVRISRLVILLSLVQVWEISFVLFYVFQRLRGPRLGGTGKQIQPTHQNLSLRPSLTLEIS
jgi:hypothetical protein